jgi:hypothetical protein
MLHQHRLRHCHRTQLGQAAAQRQGPALLLRLAEGQQQVGLTLLAALLLHQAAAMSLLPAQVPLQQVVQQVVRFRPCHLVLSCLVPQQGLGWVAAARAGTDLCNLQARLTLPPDRPCYCCFLE